MKSHIVTRRDALAETKLVWELSLLVALNKEFGFGNERLQRFLDALYETQNAFVKTATSTDRKREEYSDITTAICQLTRAADSRKIDWHELLHVEGELI